jgi:DNA polymerase/3'-5' exonuclease PolX
MMPDHRFADPDNAQVAEWLRQAAELLQAQGANPFRVGAYRKAADTVERFNGSLRTLFAMKGRDGLDALPGIGAGLASASYDARWQRAGAIARPRQCQDFSL